MTKQDNDHSSLDDVEVYPNHTQTLINKLTRLFIKLKDKYRDISRQRQIYRDTDGQTQKKISIWKTLKIKEMILKQESSMISTSFINKCCYTQCCHIYHRFQTSSVLQMVLSQRIHENNSFDKVILLFFSYVLTYYTLQRISLNLLHKTFRIIWIDCKD